MLEKQADSLRTQPSQDGLLRRLFIEVCAWVYLPHHQVPTCLQRKDLFIFILVIPAQQLPFRSLLILPPASLAQCLAQAGASFIRSEETKRYSKVAIHLRESLHLLCNQVVTAQ